MEKIDQKYQSIKFCFKLSRESIYFLDTLLYIEINIEIINRLQTILYKKEEKQLTVKAMRKQIE